MSAPRLSDKYELLLRHGDTEGRYEGDGSRLVAAIILHAVNAGCQRDYVRRLLADPTHKGGFAGLNRRRANLDRWFDAEWKRAVARVRSNPIMGDRHDATLAASSWPSRPTP